MELKRKVMVPFEDLVRQNPDLYEAVNTGYKDSEGRDVIGEYIYKGQEKITRCDACGGVLKAKAMRQKKWGNCTHIVNGLARPIGVADGCVLVLWICSRKCTDCDKNQRMLPKGVRRWMRYALSVVQAVLSALFDPEELVDSGGLHLKTGRGWETLPFYGDVSTIYRWRRQAFRWSHEDC